MQCKEAEPLVPKYLDEELAESEAGPLRQHLLECLACRGLVQEERTLKSWFVPNPPVAVPSGFAARVARRALAGDLGESELVEADVPAQRGRVFQFTLQLTAAAAVLLATLSILLTIDRRPTVTQLEADGTKPLLEALEELDELNAAEQAARDAALEVDEQDAEQEDAGK